MSKEIYPEAVVDAFAQAWASIDGKIEQYHAGLKNGDEGGYRQGYMYEANELLSRVAKILDQTPFHELMVMIAANEIVGNAK